MGLIRKTLHVVTPLVVPVPGVHVKTASKKQRAAKEANRQAQISNVLLAAAAAGKPMTYAEASKKVK